MICVVILTVSSRPCNSHLYYGRAWGTPLVSDTIPAEALSQIFLHLRFFALFHYKLRLTSLIFVILINISLIRRINTQQLLLLLSLAETLFKFPLTAEFDLDVQ